MDCNEKTCCETTCPESSEYILTTDNLTKIYGKHKAANAINLHIKKGEVYGLIGRNGAGKTTILKMICGLSNPTSGSFTFCGKTGAEVKPLMKKIGSLIESPGLYPKLTAYQNVMLKCISMGLGSKEYVLSLLDQVGLSAAAKKQAGSFSLGMKQRLGIAIALVGDPDFVVLDEPINGLDPQGIAEMREIIHSLSRDKGMTVIVSSHILDELAKVADSFGIINAGQLIDEFSSEQLVYRCGKHCVVRSNDNDKTMALLNEMGITALSINEQGLVRIDGDVEDSSVIIEKLVKSGVKVYEFATKQGTLEEYYLTRTGRTV